MTEQEKYAIIRTGGKQYRVKPGDVIDVEKLSVDKGEQVEFKEILFFQDGSRRKIGLPVVEECTVNGELVDEVRGPKVIAFKYKRRKNYRRKVGHRQHYSRVRITSIEG